MLKAKDLQTLGFHTESDAPSAELLGGGDLRDAHRAQALRNILSDYALEALPKDESDDIPKIDTDAILAVLLPLMQGKTVEECYIVMLGHRGRYDTQLVARGGTDSVQISTREITKQLLLNDATGVIVAHNHPLGYPQHSPRDIETIQKLKRILDPLQIALVDSIVIAADTFTSLRKTGGL